MTQWESISPACRSLSVGSVLSIQWVKVPATKLATLSLIPEIHKVEGEN